jgi:hypothetical protein
LEFAVPFRVLTGDEVAGAWVPCVRFDLGTRKRLTLPAFLPPPPPEDATLRAILSWASALLHGFIRLDHLWSRDRRYLSWGSLPLQRSGKGESTSVPLWASAIHQGIPSPEYVPLTGFLNLPAVCSSPDLSAIFTRMALLGFHLQGFFPPTQPR